MALHKYLPIAGTWSREVANQLMWWQCGSPFNKYMETKGFEQSLADGDCFVWTSNIDGIDPFKHTNNDWKVAGENLSHFLKGIPFEDRNLIAHSHGGQVVLYGAQEDSPINNLVTISTPVRQDMFGIMKNARPYIKNWTHIHSDHTDTWQAYGELFDGHFGIVRNMPLANKNIQIPKVSHSEIIYNPQFFHIWDDLDLFQYLK